MAAAQMALENWCMCLSFEEIDKYLTVMKLQTSVTRFQKLDRASRWLLGDYSADDFIATNADVDEHTAWVEREQIYAKVHRQSLQRRNRDAVGAELRRERITPTQVCSRQRRGEMQT